MSYSHTPWRRLALAAAAVVALSASSAAFAADPQVKFTTSEGDFTVELYPDKAPKTVENFLQYVKDKHYDGLIFHRVIKDFMVQGGGFDKDYTQRSTRAPVEHEGRSARAKGLSNVVGTIAMARTGEPHSATSQFFINPVFGKVIDGMDTVEKIRNTPTGAGGPFTQNAPQKMVIIESARIVDAAKEEKKEGN